MTMADPEPVPGPRRFTESQRSALEARTADHDRTWEAMHQLERALGSAAPGREAAWRDDVLQALFVLQSAVIEEDRNAEEPDSLLSDIRRTQPRLRTRVRGLRSHYQQLRDALGAITAEIDDREDLTPDYADLRQRLGWVLSALQHQRGRESDLIYEAYRDAFDDELSAGSGP